MMLLKGYLKHAAVWVSFGGLMLLFAGCQKELTGTIFSFGCKMAQWALVDDAGNATETYNYTYDSTNGKPQLLVYDNVTNGGHQTVVPIFSKDTVYFNTGSYAVLDNSKRIYVLEEKNSVAPSAPNGTYSYTYDASGHVATRIYDDGFTSEATTFTFTGDELTKTDKTAFAVPNAISTFYTYSAAIMVKDNNRFVFASNFPELLLYMPCFSIGRFTEKAIENTRVKINSPIVPIPEISTSYTNYQFDARGNFINVQLVDSIAGVATSKKFLAGSYLCR